MWDDEVRQEGCSFDCQCLVTQAGTNVGLLVRTLGSQTRLCMTMYPGRVVFMYIGTVDRGQPMPVAWRHPWQTSQYTGIAHQI